MCTFKSRSHEEFKLEFVDSVQSVKLQSATPYCLGHIKICNLKLDSNKYCFSKTLSRISESHWTLLLCLVQYAIHC